MERLRTVRERWERDRRGWGEAERKEKKKHITDGETMAEGKNRMKDRESMR